MKTILAAAVAWSLVLNGCAHRPCCGGPPAIPPRAEQFILAAQVDGSGRFVFSNEGVRYEHKFWQRPWNVTLNGEPWSNLGESPSYWAEFARDLDLTRAQITRRAGRDVVALERTEAGFDLYLSDTPNGDDHYTVTITIPRRQGSPNTACEGKGRN